MSESTSIILAKRQVRKRARACGAAGIYRRIFRVVPAVNRDARSGSRANWPSQGRLLGAPCRGPLPAPAKSRPSGCDHALSPLLHLRHLLLPAQHCFLPALAPTVPGPVPSSPRSVLPDPASIISLLLQRIGYTTKLSHGPPIPRSKEQALQRSGMYCQNGARDDENESELCASCGVVVCGKIHVRAWKWKWKRKRNSLRSGG